MRLSILLAAAGLVSAQSNPSWWKYAPPEATAIVGIQWKTMQSSLFAPAIASELAPGGSFGFPDMELLRTAEQLLIGSPTMLTIEYGDFPAAKFRTQATEAGLKRTSVKGAELWVSADPAVMSVAYIHEKLLLIGSSKKIEETVARVANPKERSYSPLLARAARYSKEDLWVVSSRLPDPLASLFVPLEVEASAFEGSVSQWDGLHLVAAIERPSPSKAMDLADDLAETLASRPAMAESTEITTRERSVLIRMDLDEAQLAASLRTPTVPAAQPAQATHEIVAVAAPSKPQPRAFVPPAVAATPVAPAKAVTNNAISASIPEAAVVEPEPQGSPQAVIPPAPPRPKMIRILGLGSEPVEIPLGH